MNTLYTVRFSLNGRRYMRAIYGTSEQDAAAIVEKKWPGAEITSIKS